MVCAALLTPYRWKEMEISPLACNRLLLASQGFGEHDVHGKGVSRHLCDPPTLSSTALDYSRQRLADTILFTKLIEMSLTVPAAISAKLPY